LIFGRDKDECPRIQDADLANRFFFGDIDTLQALRTGYSGLV
jgi:hypothetical protein